MVISRPYCMTIQQVLQSRLDGIWLEGHLIRHKSVFRGCGQNSGMLHLRRKFADKSDGSSSEALLDAGKRIYVAVARNYMFPKTMLYKPAGRSERRVETPSKGTPPYNPFMDSVHASSWAFAAEYGKSSAL